jgi:hypothetical protein
MTLQPQSDTAVILTIFIGLWTIYFFLSVPIYLARIAKNTKRIADNTERLKR